MLKTVSWSSFIHIEWEYNYLSPVAGLQERKTENKNHLHCRQFVNLSDKAIASVLGSPCIVLIEKKKKTHLEIYLSAVEEKVECT